MANNTTQLRDHAQSIFNAAIHRVLPENCIPDLFTLEDDLLKAGTDDFRLDQYENIYVVAFGKAANRMFHALHSILGGRISGGTIICNTPVDDQYRVGNSDYRYMMGSHPLPSADNISAAEAAIDMCKKSQPDDLVIFLISGGGSALLFAPKSGIELDKYQQLVDDLMKSGATINELNTVRTALSRVKGGQMLHYLQSSTVLNIIISDVIGDPPHFIASGPTVPSEFESYSQLANLAKSTLEKYGLYRKYFQWVSTVLDESESELARQIEPHTYFAGSNRLALLSAKSRAEEFGYKTVLLSSMLEGESQDVGNMLGSVLYEVLESGNPVEKPCCILSGGETTVTVTGEGAGGRNQELALGAASILRDAGGGLILSAGSDGIDGPTDAAGAIVDSTTAFRAVHNGLSIRDALNQNDSYHFFQALDDLVITGPTGTNVMDIQIGLVA